ncbi:NDP-hexose 2,3-dehydratase family protein [Streptosporangium amethystogenes subsp. fukuiense]|uniref:NDP-hexose 2,3-dehydratase family protein n=1 Tax=Streptosporangium amethystogenes subsp. fukuiense TaxID=698418 RepID=A0ABW2T2H5_9ACTN
MAVSPRRQTRSPLQVRLAESVLSPGGWFATLDEFHRWLSETASRAYMNVRKVPLNGLSGWEVERHTGNIRHRTGKFFSVECLDVHVPGRTVSHWSQPIINQPEIGILGILVKEIDGIPHCLMQAKHEPGNHNGLQLSPTVQATRSNYTRVHRGRPVPYLDYFLDTSGREVIADIRQSEQGAWFYRKRNRNMIVEITGEIEVAEGFCWLTLGQLHTLMSVPDLVNMDARTVLACMPFSGAGLTSALMSALTSAPSAEPGDGFRAALVRSCDPGEAGPHTMGEVLSWITDMRTRTDPRVSLIPLNEVRGWRRTDELISHETGRYFDVVGVSVEAGGREVGHWDQPMIEPSGTGVIAFLVGEIDGVLHALVHARVEPGYADVVELGPTVQCTPENYEHLPAGARPPFLDEVLGAGPGRVRFETILSEEGGRFHRARNRYLIVHTDAAAGIDHPEYRWLSVSQLGELLRHSFYLNIQARSLLFCLTTLTTTPPAPLAAR